MSQSPAACPVCASTQAAPIFTQNGYDIVRCVACGLRYVSPTPSAEILRAHYQDPAYFEGCAGQGYRNYADMEKALLPHFKRRLEIIAARANGRGQLLDFGCASGLFLKLARADGWRIAGVELSQDMAGRAARDLGIPIASSLDALDATGFDAISSWEVIEHLPQPIVELNRLREHLRPGGLIALSTPNTGHWQAVREPASWEGYRPPSHLLFFDAHTLADTLRRAGFESIEIRRVAPLPPLPERLRRITAPLQRALATGQARPWVAALLLWRAIRLLAWGWQKIAQPRDDIFTTLEAVAFRPA